MSGFSSITVSRIMLHSGHSHTVVQDKTLHPPHTCINSPSFPVRNAFLVVTHRHIHTHICSHTQTGIHTHTQKHTHSQTDIHIHIHMHTHIHTHTYTHTHIHTFSLTVLENIYSPSIKKQIKYIQYLESYITLRVLSKD